MPSDFVKKQKHIKVCSKAFQNITEQKKTTTTNQKNNKNSELNLKITELQNATECCA